MTPASSGRGMRGPLRLWLTLTHALVLVIPFVVLLGTGLLVRQLHLQARAALFDQAQMVQIAVNQGDTMMLPRSMGRMFAEIHRRTGTSVHLLDMDGRPMLSAGDMPDDLAEHPQVLLAYAGTPDTRGLATSEGAMWGSSAPIVTAFPVQRVVRMPFRAMTSPVGVLVLTRPAPSPLLSVTHLGTRLTIVGVIMLTLSLGVATFVAGRMAQPLRLLADAADEVAAGRFDAVAQVRRPRRLRITEIDALAVAFIDMSDRLRRRLQWIREFASNVSHEFKTPLATLQGTVELLQDSPEMPAEQRERFLDNAAADLERLDRMVAGLMDLAEAEEVERRSAVDLDAIVDELVRTWDDVHREGEAGSVWGDPQQVAAVLRNLVHNAVQHGGPGVSVTVRSRRDDRHVTLQVEDDGPGISEGNLPRVFERFFTTARDSGGTGLGLALVRAICEAHGGSISVDSRPGRTVFEVVLPAA